MRVEGDDRGGEPGRLRGLDHAAMAQVHAVERAQGDRAFDAHSAATASSAGMIRAGSASSTRNGPDLGPAQRDAVAAQLVGDRANVRTRADEEVEGRDAPVVAEQLGRVDRRAPDRHLDGNAFAMQLVRALAADLHGRSGRDLQVDLAAELLDELGELLLTRRIVGVERLTFEVSGARSRRQVDFRHVALVETHEALRQLRAAAEEDEQEPRRERVERPRMPRPGAGAPAQVAHDRERRGACRFVDEHEARWIKPPRRHALPGIAHGGSRRSRGSRAATKTPPPGGGRPRRPRLARSRRRPARPRSSGG